MARNDQREALGIHVQRAIAAARMTLVQLTRQYPHITEKGFMRPTDTGRLYRRIGLVLLQLPPQLLEKLLALQANVGLCKLRAIANRKRSLQENVTKVRLTIIELSNHKPGLKKTTPAKKVA